MRKNLQLQAEMTQEVGACVFDVTLDCEDGAPVGGEAEHAQLVVELALAAAPEARVGVRVHPVDHPSFQADIATIAGRAGQRLTHIMIPKVETCIYALDQGVEGVVIGAKKFSRRLHMNEEQKKQLKKDITTYEAEMDAKAIGLFKQMVGLVNGALGAEMVDPSTRQKVGASDIDEVILEQIQNFSDKWMKGSKEARDAAMVTYGQFWPRIQAIAAEKERKVGHMKRGDELPSGVLEMVKVYVVSDTGRLCAEPEQLFSCLYIW